MKSAVILNSIDETSTDAEMPEGWAAVPLEDIGTLYCGQSPATRFVNTTRTGTPYITGPDQWDGDELHVDKWTTDPRRKVPDGCIFVTVKGAGVGTIFPGVTGAIGRDIYAFKPAAEVHNSFVQRALEFTVSEIKRNAAGDIPGLSKDHLLKHGVKLPPRNEQERIIAAINNLFVLSKSASDHLSRIPVILKRFRQAVLAAACSGRLTEDWREKHPNTESARSLLDRILTERGARFKEKPKAVPRAKYPESNDQKQRDVDTDSLPDVPDSWTCVTWDDLTDWITYGFTRPMPHFPDGIPIVTAKNVLDGKVDFSSADFTSKDAFAKLSDKDRPLRGEILLTKDGSIGRAAIVDTDEPFCINQSVAVLRFGGLTAHVPYLLRVIQSPFTQGLIREGTGGTAVPHISITTFGRFAVPLPPVEEQVEIARRVNGLFSLAEGIEGRLAKGYVRANKLTQSIFSRAFRGELVPTEAELARREGREYEPASVLLERIRKERESQVLSKPERKRTHMKSKLTTAKGYV